MSEYCDDDDDYFDSDDFHDDDHHDIHHQVSPSMARSALMSEQNHDFDDDDHPVRQRVHFYEDDDDDFDYDDFDEYDDFDDDDGNNVAETRYLPSPKMARGSQIHEFLTS